MLLIGALDAGSTPKGGIFSACGEVASRMFGEHEIAGPIPARLTMRSWWKHPSIRYGGAAVRLRVKEARCRSDGRWCWFDSLSMISSLRGVAQSG